MSEQWLEPDPNWVLTFPHEYCHNCFRFFNPQDYAWDTTGWDVKGDWVFCSPNCQREAMMQLSKCKSCKAEFSNPAYLIEHWNRSHKHAECLRCMRTKIGAKDPLFCDTCVEALGKFVINLSRLEKIEKEILRSARRQQRWEWRTQNLLALRETLLEKPATSPYSALEEFCGHGNRRGQCIPCNPIFENMTAEGFVEAEKNLHERMKAEMYPQAKIKAKAVDNTIYVELD